MNQIKLNFFKSFLKENFINDAYSFLDSINFYTHSANEKEFSFFSTIYKKFNSDPIFSQILELYKSLKAKSLTPNRETETDENKQNENRKQTPKNEENSIQNKYSQMIEIIMKKKKEDEEKQIQFEQNYQKLLSILEDEDLFSFNKILKEDSNLQERLFKEKGENFEKIVSFEQTTLNYFLSEINERKSYTKINNPGFEMYFKKGKTDITLQFEKEVEMDIVDFISLIYENEIYPKWFPFTYHAETVLQVGKAKKLIYMINNIPVLADRDFLVYGFGINRIAENKCMYLLCKSIDETSGIFKEQCERKETKNYVRGEIKLFGYEINIISKKKLFIRGMMNVDPKIKVVPQFLVNTVSQKFGTDLFAKLISISKNYKGSIYENKNPSKIDKQFYDFIKENTKNLEN